jgi:hypothetical protein
VEELLEAGVVAEGRECGVSVQGGEITKAEIQGFLEIGESFFFLAIPCIEGTQPVEVTRRVSVERGPSPASRE